METTITQEYIHWLDSLDHEKKVTEYLSNVMDEASTLALLALCDAGLENESNEFVEGRRVVYQHAKARVDYLRPLFIGDAVVDERARRLIDSCTSDAVDILKAAGVETDLRAILCERKEPTGYLLTDHK